MTKRTMQSALAGALAALSLAACQNEERSMAPSAAGAPIAELRGGGRMDEASKTAMVLRQIHAENQEEIETGKLAVDRAQNAEVKKFATQMVSDHTAADQKLTDLAKRTNIDISTSSQTPVEAAMAAASESSKRMLRGFSGAQFDVAYIAPQAHHHELALQLVEQGQKFATGDTKRLLDETRPIIESHLEHAKSLMRGLSFAPIGVGGGPMGNESKPGVIAPAGGRDAGMGMGGHQAPGRPSGGSTKPNP
jgi:putative membrane protein